MTESVEALRQRIQEELVASGKYDEISNLLKLKLIDSGWYDKVKSMAQVQASNEANPTFATLSKKLEPKAMEMVPEAVEREALIKIKQFLDSVVE
ncbi:unnamed protein product [Kuraishia capsulata CBS 1993]|uniref:Transcription and mRNA export factor SUS1 n=1 Tax=Kuraishia capsulata CBS 1993 TaxID=1382522 RepID=W6MT11_9ASCO|nr:uncharacterized protein KUCA_T00000887001 [Kuraishia capsulata CBS 1993]CDK24920.1 unnamed protein product [Kuraishia capsulata CBS 1993]